ncbi:hypothetical protein X474_05475 [Dethiosulfatarculus sandiegensis]|uniref:Uncharacterized protein n=1 Tax=Dethiosulfatarculus sandiegensis TaxID=1429043 RepID=A0A0D2JAT2_9BACT|nr:hypothetical protein X474_05475 [Dethiosulfatarculus sandiegensis]
MPYGVPAEMVAFEPGSGPVGGFKFNCSWINFVLLIFETGISARQV